MSEPVRIVGALLHSATRTRRGWHYCFEIPGAKWVSVRSSKPFPWAAMRAEGKVRRSTFTLHVGAGLAADLGLRREVAA